MKIATKEERFNPTTGKVEMMNTDLLNNLREDATAVFSMVTQCDSNVVLEKPEKLRSVAGFDHYCTKGEFSSGDAFGVITFGWTVRQENPEYYDVMSITMNMCNMGWCDIDYRSPGVFLHRVTQEYQLYLETKKSVPKKFPEIEELLRQIRVVPMPQVPHDEVVKLVDQISALLGNTMSKQEQIALYGKELKHDKP